MKKIFNRKTLCAVLFIAAAAVSAALAAYALFATIAVSMDDSQATRTGSSATNFSKASGDGAAS